MSCWGGDAAGIYWVVAMVLLISHRAQDGPTAENNPAPDVCSAEGEKLHDRRGRQWGGFPEITFSSRPFSFFLTTCLLHGSGN